MSDVVRSKVEEWKSLGVTPADALRMAEKLCVHECIEFHPSGPKIVEEVYGGTFRLGAGGSGVRFFPTSDGIPSMWPPAPAPVVDATPVAIEPTVVEPVDATPVEIPIAEQPPHADLFTAMEILDLKSPPDRTPASSLSQIEQLAAGPKKKAKQ